MDSGTPFLLSGKAHLPLHFSLQHHQRIPFHHMRHGKSSAQVREAPDKMCFFRNHYVRSHQ
nr:MAG TPA: hypothetical protein [Crassvirales sp.]